MTRVTAILMLSLACVCGAAAEPTSVTVRALANDAKLIPGVTITLRDADTGAVLASGVTEGGTGDTAAIMREPVARGAPVYDTEGAARYVSELDLDGPKRVAIEAVQAETGAAASQTLWLTPGGDVGGNGVVLELYGLKVAIRGEARAARAGEPLPVTAEVRMLCGCPVEPGGLWDADGFSVRAELLRDGEPVARDVLDYAGKTSIFTGEVEAPAPGDYRLRVTASQEERGNYGVDSAPVTISSQR